MKRRLNTEHHHLATNVRAFDITVCSRMNKHNIVHFSPDTEIESLLLTLRSLSARDDEVKELNILEGMLKSNTFKRAKQV